MSFLKSSSTLYLRGISLFFTLLRKFIHFSSCLWDPSFLPVTPISYSSPLIQHTPHYNRIRIWDYRLFFLIVFDNSSIMTTVWTNYVSRSLWIWILWTMITGWSTIVISRGSSFRSRISFVPWGMRTIRRFRWTFGTTTPRTWPRWSPTRTTLEIPKFKIKIFFGLIMFLE